MPRTGTVTRVTKAKVFFNTINSVGEAVHEVTTRAMFGNAAIVEVL